MRRPLAARRGGGTSRRRRLRNKSFIFEWICMCMNVLLCLCLGNSFAHQHHAQKKQQQQQQCISHLVQKPYSLHCLEPLRSFLMHTLNATNKRSHAPFFLRVLLSSVCRRLLITVTWHRIRARVWNTEITTHTHSDTLTQLTRSQNPKRAMHSAQAVTTLVRMPSSPSSAAAPANVGCDVVMTKSQCFTFSIHSNVLSYTV